MTYRFRAGFMSAALMLLLSVAVVAYAQWNNTCPDIVQRALDAVSTACAATGRNQACFGNVQLSVTPQDGVPAFRFEQVGDLVDVASIQSLQLSPMDVSGGAWGVVMMQLQANLPDTLPGQNVTFLLMGDVQVTNTAAAGQTPMQAFYMTTGIGDSQCAQAPQSGVVVQTPRGVGQVAFNVNGVDVTMGSTVVFRAQRGGTMRVATVEGAAFIRANGKTVPVLGGSQADVPLDDDLNPGDPDDPTPYDPDDFAGIPFDAFDDPVDVRDPLTDDQIQQVLDDWADGLPLCSDDADSFLPTCDDVPPFAGGTACVFNADDDPDAPLCDLNDVYRDLGCIYPPQPGDPPLDDALLALPFCDVPGMVPGDGMWQPTGTLADGTLCYNPVPPGINAPPPPDGAVMCPPPDGSGSGSPPDNNLPPPPPTDDDSGGDDSGDGDGGGGGGGDGDSTGGGPPPPPAASPPPPPTGAPPPTNLPPPTNSPPATPQ